MTEIHKPFSRRTRAPFAHYRRRIVVTLEPGDVLTMRLEKTRTRYSAPLGDVFRLLARWHANAEAARKREERKARTAGRA
jgi:hypothetical protein